MSTETMINNSNVRPRKAARLAREEEELKELIEQSKGVQEETTEEEIEEVVEQEEKETVKTEEPEVEPEPEEEELSAEEKTYKKRYADLRSYSAKKEAEYKAELEKAKTSVAKPPSSEEELEAWYEANPETASVIKTFAQNQAKELITEAEQRLAKLDEIQLETDKEKAKQEIRKAHPDFDKIVQSDEFHEWAEELPEMFQEVLFDPEQTNSAPVIKVFTMYKAEKGLTPQGKKSKAKEAAESVATKKTPKPSAEGSTKKFSETDVRNMSIKEYEENEEAIMEAISSGNFVYNISGGAR